MECGAGCIAAIVLGVVLAIVSTVLIMLILRAYCNVCEPRLREKSKEPVSTEAVAPNMPVGLNSGPNAGDVGTSESVHKENLLYSQGSENEPHETSTERSSDRYPLQPALAEEALYDENSETIIPLSEQPRVNHIQRLSVDNTGNVEFAANSYPIKASRGNVRVNKEVIDAVHRVEPEKNLRHTTEVFTLDTYQEISDAHDRVNHSVSDAMERQYHQVHDCNFNEEDIHGEFNPRMNQKLHAIPENPIIGIASDFPSRPTAQSQSELYTDINETSPPVIALPGLTPESQHQLHIAEPIPPPRSSSLAVSMQQVIASKSIRPDLFANAKPQIRDTANQNSSWEGEIYSIAEETLRMPR